MGDLKLDTDTLKNTKENTSSLEDIYGYYVFSKEYKNKEREIKRVEKEDVNKNINAVFENKKTTDLNHIYNIVMHSESAALIKSDYIKKQKDTNLYNELALFMLGMFVALILLLAIDRSWNAKRNNNRKRK